MDNSEILSCGKEIEDKIFFQSKLLEAVNDSIVVTDYDGNITFWNNASEKLFGWTVEEVLGKPFSLFLEETYIQDIPTQINEVGKGIWEGRLPIITKSGEKKYVRVSVSTMYDQQNKPTNLVGVFTDITEIIKSKTEAEEALRSKSEFLANVSHEIRTPMTGILGYVELLSKLPMDNKQKQYLQAIKENASQLLELINDILDLSKIEANKMLLEESSFNLKDLVFSSVKIFEPAIKNKNLDFSIDITDDLPEKIISDSIKIKQILSNLVSNAIKFTPQGKIDIRVYKGEMLNGKKFVLCIEVEDTGIGVPPNKIPLLFEPFVQADSSTTRKYGGTGLGLAICKKLVEILGGDIKVESEVDKGSKFMFKIPVSEVKTTSKGDVFIAKKAEEKLYKLLFISPDEDLFSQINTALYDSELELLWAKNVNRIMSIISFYEPDVIVLDITNDVKDKELQQIKFASLPPSTKLYFLTAESDVSPLSIPNNIAAKYIDSLEELLTDLKSFSIIKETAISNSIGNVLLVDENKVSLMLMYNILSNQGYSVEPYSNISSLSADKGPFDVVLMDTAVIEKHGQAVVDNIQNFNCKALIGISSHDEINNYHDLFTDIIYKPVTSQKLLSAVNKHMGGKGY